MATPDFDPGSTFTTTIQATNTLTPASDTKRNLFGRKKKSATSLASSPSTGTLTSEQSESVESLHNSTANDDGSGSLRKKKGGAVKNVFKRRGKIDTSANSSIIEGSNESRESVQSETKSSGQGPSATSEDGESLKRLDSYESEAGDITPTLEHKGSSGFLSSTSPPSSQAGIKAPSKTSFFNRRSASPMGPPNRSSTTPLSAPEDQAEGEKLPNTPEARPSTSAGETSRPSEDHGRRAGRSSASRTDGNDISKDDGDRRQGPIDCPKISTTNADTAEAPRITATPPTPVEGQNPFPPVKNQPVSVKGAQKRGRTNSTSKTPSKLSQSMTSPPSPPVASVSDVDKAPDRANQEGTKGNGGGFFQSMFSVAQSAATNLTNNIPLNLANNQGERPKNVTAGSERNEESIEVTKSVEDGPDENIRPEREPAVKTLGYGELNLAALGITDADDSADKENARPANNEPKTNGQQAVVPTTNGQRGFEAGDPPLSVAAQSLQRHLARTPLAEDNAPTVRGDSTPEQDSIHGTDGGEDTFDDRKRSGSVRSGGASSDKTKRRHRGSSATSGGLLHPVPRATGFAVATKKRNRDFHNLFRSVPEDDYLIEDYGCALQKEILLQGRFYISEGHICFYSNILGWVTTLVISFDEVVSVEKKSTALLFPNGIVIQTLHAKHTFASFISRDATYDLIIGLWNVGHPQLVQGQGEAHLDNTVEVDVNDESGEEEDEYEESDDELGGSFMDAGMDGGHEELGEPLATSRNPSRKPSELPLGGQGGAAAVDDFPGPPTHAPTSCVDDDQHYDKVLCNEVLPVPIGKVYSLMFGSQSYSFVTRLLNDEEKVLELQIPNKGEWVEEGGKKVRNYSYIKPLGGSIGPKQTKCLITETIDHCDFENRISVTVSTATPDVPSGNAFLVKTRYCLTWGENNGTRLLSNCTVEWSGKSWIKGPIEKGANDGQVAFIKSLLNCLRREIAPKRLQKPYPKGKGKRRKDFTAPDTVSPPNTATRASQEPQDSWGLLEPAKPFLGPVVDIIKPFLPANFPTIVLLLLITWLAIGKVTQQSPEKGVDRHGAHGRGHWEGVWRSEEEGLWDWLEDRTGMNAMTLQDRDIRSKAYERSAAAKIASEGMKDHQIRDAIQVMGERLEALKRIVDEKKPESGDS